MLGDIPHVHPVNHNSTTSGVIEAHEQMDKSRFTTPCAANESHRLARLCCKRNMFQHIFFGTWILEGYILEFHYSRKISVESLRVFRINNSWLGFKNFAYSVGGNASAGEH